jgi:nucleotide-binding universal stress UspA family protein
VATRGSIRTILVATDLTETTEQVFRTARMLAAATDAEIHVIHVIEDDAVVTDSLARQRAEQVERTEFLDAVRQWFDEDPRLAETHAYLGDPAEVIIGEAERVSADVILLGSHQSRGFGDRVLGSTAESVVRKSKAPVLILNGPLHLPIRRMVIPTDFSDPARRAASVALAWARANVEPATVTLAHVAGVEFALSRDEDLRRDLKTEAGDASRKAEDDVRMETRLLRGSDPAGALITYAEETETDLIVLGTNGENALKRAFLGSVSSAMVRRAAFPLLLVPPGR